MSQTVKIDHWEKPPKINRRLVPIMSQTRGQFRRLLHGIDSKVWFMTEVQRATMENVILEDWDRYKEILSYDGTPRHFKQLQDMARLGGGVIVIDAEYGMGKSVIANSHLKIWQLIKKVKHPPYVYFKKAVARPMITNAPKGTAHSIDEGGQRSTGSGAITLEKHLGNFGQVIRKTDKLLCMPGLDIGTGYLGKSIAFSILPFGINFFFQANRFIVSNSKGEPLYMAVIQRCYFPWEHVFYQDGLGTWAEYEQRAIKYSTTSTGVISGRNPIAEKQYVEDLKKHWIETYGSMTPTLDVLKYEARQIGVPPENEDMVHEVASTAKFQMRKDRSEVQDAEIHLIKDSTTWKEFRDGLRKLCGSWEYAKAFAHYTVPEDPEVSYADIVDELDLKILAGSLGKQIRQGRRRLRRDSKKAIGDLGEMAVTSWLDTASAKWGGGGDGVNDVTAWIDGNEVAINVKTTLADHFKEHLEVTPECDHDHGLAVLLVPRLLEIRIYELDQGQQYRTINSRDGRLSTPETLEQSIRELVT